MRHKHHSLSRCIFYAIMTKVCSEPIGAILIERMVILMDEQIFNMFLKEGGYALLFVWMLFSTMKNNKDRETKYQEVINKNQTVIEEQAKAFSSISKDVTEIKQIIVGEKGDKK